VNRKRILIALIFIGGMLAGICGVLIWQNRPQPTPDTSILAKSLQNAAQTSIEVPAFSDAHLELTVDKSKIDAEVDRIKRLASGFGGTAIQGAMDTNGTEVLAQIPAQVFDQFCSAVRNRDQAQEASKSDPSNTAKADSIAGVLVEVKLKLAP
jgi:hypothetical protein